MEGQWHELRESLKSRLYEVKGIQNPFFCRLLTVITDRFSGMADIVKAYYDALVSAHAYNVVSPSLPLVGTPLLETMAATGLVVDKLSGEVKLAKTELLDIETDVYSLKQRRFLEKPVMDVSLAAKLPSGEFSHYIGRGQQTAIRVALTSPDDSMLFINLPTGCGKTLLIHALVLMTSPLRLNLVIVPTVALAIEQGERAAEILRAADQHHGGTYAWVGRQAEDTRTGLRERLKAGSQRILFCAPEAARTSLLPILFQLAKHAQLGAFVVDEAHLIDQWGSGFRPDFQLLAPLVQSLQGAAPRGIKKILMSATFSPATMVSLANIFAESDRNPIQVNANFLRPEIGYYLTCSKSPDEHTQQVLTQLRRMPRPLILYVTKKADAQRWYDILSQGDYHRVGLFHGDTSTEKRERLISQWRTDCIDIMVATSAFGVGMDKSNIRSVLHASVPENLDRYYQECGRGGRDGKASIAHLIYHKGQIDLARNLSQEKIISTELGYERWSYMFRNKKRKPDGRFSINLAIKRKDIMYDSNKNIAWNWRTLLLMKRAKFIQLYFSDPQMPQEGITDREQLTDFYNDYFSHVDIEIRDDGHLDRRKWDNDIERQRIQERQEQLTGFAQLKEWLDRPTTKLCSLLSSFYTINGYIPESSCGGCPGCRKQRSEPFTPSLGSLVQPVLGWYPTDSGNMGNEQRIHYKGLGSTPRELVHKWRHLIAFLLQKGIIRAIRARSEVHEILNRTVSFNEFWCSLTPDETNSIWNELVLVMPDERYIPRTDLYRNNRISFIPNHLPDPAHPARIWIDCDQQAISIDDYERGLSYVDY